MPLIYLETFIKAPVEIVFDISRSIDIHKSSMTKYKEEIIDGITGGLVKKGDTVTWQAKHLFKIRRLKSKIRELDAPHFFADEMVEGDFKKLYHEHYFIATNNATIMVDKFYFESPFGIFGKLVNFLFLKNYMKRLLVERNHAIKRIAEDTSMI